MELVIVVIAFIFKVLELPWTGLKMLGKRIVDWLYHIRATGVQISDGDVRAIQNNLPINVAVDIQIAKLVGTYWFQPQAYNRYVIFIRKAKQYWPQSPINFASTRKWDATIRFGASGLHHVIVAEISPEVELVFKYYRELIGEIDRAKETAMSSVPEQYKPSIKKIPAWKSIEIPHRLSGLTVLQEFEIQVG